MPKSLQEIVDQVLVNAGLDKGPTVRLPDALHRMAMTGAIAILEDGHDVRARDIGEEIIFSKGQEKYTIKKK